MTRSRKVRRRDVEKILPKKDFIAGLRRLADALEGNQRFAIQVAGERVFVPRSPTFEVEHEREGGIEELEFQLRWKTARRRRQPANR